MASKYKPSIKSVINQTFVDYKEDTRKFLQNSLQTIKETSKWAGYGALGGLMAIHAAPIFNKKSFTIKGSKKTRKSYPYSMGGLVMGYSGAVMAQLGMYYYAVKQGCPELLLLIPVTNITSHVVEKMIRAKKSLEDRIQK